MGTDRPAPYTAQKLEGTHHSFGEERRLVGLPSEAPPRCQLLPRAHDVPNWPARGGASVRAARRHRQSLVAVWRARRRRRESGVGGGSGGRHARLHMAATRARGTPTHLILPDAAGRSRNIDPQTEPAVGRGGPIRAGGRRWPSKCGRRRQRPFELVSCRFRVEIRARSVPWLHCRPTAPFVSRRRAANGPRRARAAPPPSP